MGMRQKLYVLLVNRVPAIRDRYSAYRLAHSGRFSRLAYLLGLNIRYYLLRQPSLRKSSGAGDDEGIRIPQGGESAASLAESPEELVRKTAEFDVVSFDVFDTLILRPCRAPADLFWLVAQRLSYPDFPALRQQAEALARKEAQHSPEVTFEEIWEQTSRLTGIPAREGMEAEWQAELENCFANPYFLEVVSLLKQQGRRMIICSDMYLGEARIRRLLENCGYPEFEAYFVSSDYGVSKSTGLYSRVRQALGEKTRVVHIGDNPVSDIREARRSGFQAMACQNVNAAGEPFRPREMSPVFGSVYAGIVNAHLHNGLRAFSPAYELGYVYGGLLVTGYCRFIHDYVHAHGIDRILFLARDGQILDRVYRQLYPEDAALCRYVYWSRLAAIKLCAHRYKHHYMERMLLHKADGSYTVGQILRAMELEDMTGDFLAAMGPGWDPDRRFTRRTAGDLRRYLEQNWDTVTAHYRAESEEARRYYARVLEGAHSAVAVDVGWSGSGPLFLRYLVEQHWGLDCRITGILAGSCGSSNGFEASEAEIAAEHLVCYLFSSRHNRDIWKAHDAALGHNLAVELLLSATTPSFRGFRKDASGSYSFTDFREHIDSAAIQQGILDFADHWQRRSWLDSPISGRDAAAPVRVLCSNRAWVEQLIADSEIRQNVE